MKLLISIYLVLFSFSASTQELIDAELDIIMNDIVSPLEAGEIDVLFKHVTFPFLVGDKKYSKSELRVAFKKVFAEKTISCLKDRESYQIALPNDHTWYMAVCFSTHEGYDASVFSFKKMNGVWMLKSIGLDND